MENLQIVWGWETAAATSCKSSNTVEHQMNKQHSDDLHSLSHTEWSWKYHIVFAPKYRRKALYDARRIEIGSILRQLCEWKGVKYSRGRSVHRPRSYASRDTAENECIRIQGISKRKEQSDNIWEMGKCKI